MQTPLSKNRSAAAEQRAAQLRPKLALVTKQGAIGLCEYLEARRAAILEQLAITIEIVQSSKYQGQIEALDRLISELEKALNLTTP